MEYVYWLRLDERVAARLDVLILILMEYVYWRFQQLRNLIAQGLS